MKNEVRSDFRTNSPAEIPPFCRPAVVKEQRLPASDGPRPSVAPMFSKRWFVLLGGFLLSSTLLPGCSEPVEPIESYTVPKEDAVYAANHVERNEPKPVKGRMFGLLIFDGTTTWSFKLSGPDENLDGLAPAFADFTASIQFKNGVPEWKTPKGWTQLPDDKAKGSKTTPRFATIRIGEGNDAPELAVHQLNSDPRIPLEELILANVNRWRDQLGLQPTSAKNLYRKMTAAESKKAENVEEVHKSVIDGRTFVFVHLTGMLKTGGNPRAPFMNMMR